jgi:hypothetical protein
VGETVAFVLFTQQKVRISHDCGGTSESYESESGRDNGIASVARNAPDAAVVELV